MVDFSKIRFDDASVKDVRISQSIVEVDYADWQERLHTLQFNNAISCFILAAHGKELSHGQIEDNGEYLRECCEVAEEDSAEQYRLFNFIDAWNGRKILRIVAEEVIEKS